MKCPCFAGVLVTALVVFQGFAEETGVVDTTGSEKTSVSGCVHLSAGQIVSGTYNGNPLSRAWQQRLVGNITMKTKPSERLTVYLGAEIDLNYSIKAEYLMMETLIRYITVYPMHFEGVVSILDNPNYTLQAGLGAFSYQYNPAARDFGEYLFRSSCYPPNLSTAFDFTEARLLGLRIHNTLFSTVTQDILLTSEMNYPPMYDYSLAYIVSDKIGEFLTLGAGVNFHHLISVDEEKTTYTGSADNRFIDTTTTPHDTGYYSFRGTKLMGTFCLDPKAFFKSNIFGKEDLRFYGEIAVLGLKNYPVYYEKLQERMPIMLGFNIPCFNVLDVFAIEAEYYANPWSNSYANQLPNGAMIRPPLPIPSGGDNHSDDFKWAVYLKKTILKNCSFIFQIANDHMRTREASLNYADMDETLHKGDWYYMGKIKFTF